MSQVTPNPVDPRPSLARDRTGMARFRTQLALNRTTLAWIQTAFRSGLAIGRDFGLRVGLTVAA
jgi:uncharacterized membrane protein YidH (DUF202 family)